MLYDVRNFSYNKANVMKNLYGCKIIYSLCKTMAQVGNHMKFLESFLP